jgi:hypothetical protein
MACTEVHCAHGTVDRSEVLLHMVPRVSDDLSALQSMFDG